MFNVARRSKRSVEFLESDRRIRQDAYLAWLCKMVGGWLEPDHGNLRAFDHAIRHLPPQGAVIEIGSFLGASTNALAYLLMKHQRDHPFFSCEPWAFEGVDEPIGGYFNAGSETFRRYAKEVFCMNAALFSSARRPYTVEAGSSDFFDRWDRHAMITDVFGRSIALGGPISFAYIDGAHTYEAVKRDFVGVDSHLLPGGFLLFDDSDDGGCFPEVSRLAQEVAHHPSYQVVFMTPHYFFQKR